MVNRDVINNFGYVSRMDSINASVLNFRLDNLKKVGGYSKKEGLTLIFIKEYLNKKYVFFRQENRNQYNTYRAFVIQVNDRDNLRKYLKSKRY